MGVDDESGLVKVVGVGDGLGGGGEVACDEVFLRFMSDGDEIGLGRVVEGVGC